MGNGCAVCVSLQHIMSTALKIFYGTGNIVVCSVLISTCKLQLEDAVRDLDGNSSDLGVVIGLALK